MKPIKTVLAGLALFGVATTAALAEPSTDATIVRITGSTAFRSATHAAIAAIYDSPPVAGYAGGNLSGSGRSFFYGQISGQPVIITTSWSGSVGGVQTVSQSIACNFLNDNLADSGQPALALSTSGGTQISTSSSFGANSQLPDVAMSDTFQSATPFKTPVLADQKVGVIGFKWLVNRGNSVVNTTVDTSAGSAVLTVGSSAGITAGMTVRASTLPTAPLLKVASVDSGTQVTLTSGTGVTAGTGVSASFAAPAPITNMNNALAQALWSNGTAKLAQFTGNSADTGTVYATGRDPDSGTRLTTFAETGIGVDSTVTQYKPTTSGTKITSLAPYAPTVINGIAISEGNSGEASGGTLAGYFGLTTEDLGAGTYIIGYTGTGDAPTATNLGGAELTHNGVAYSDAAVKEGKYTFWCYEHLLYPSTWSGASTGTPEAKKRDVADKLGLQIRTVNAPIKLTEMNCSRTADGSVVFHN